MKSLIILGRQPELGLAELESLYGSVPLKPYSDSSVVIDVEPSKIDFARLGGSTKLCKILTELPSKDWSKLSDHLAENCPKHAELAEAGKLTIGLSVIGIRTNPKAIEQLLLQIKKSIKSSGRPVRIVPNKSLELNAAQVIHNNLTNGNGWELVAVSDGKTTILAQTVNIQDIESYAARDQARPNRDSRVGMLPPKLAQIIINLAAGSGGQNRTLLDPFCGTGVVLQEASLMGFDAYGTDLEPRMVEYSIANLHWLRQKYSDINNYVRIEIGDATTHSWHKPVDIVAGETYLGAPLTHLPAPKDLERIVGGVNAIHKKFLLNIYKQLPKGCRMCLAVPAWYVGNGRFITLPILDHLKELGYNELKFTWAKNKLIYHRENQFVGRHLVTIVKEH